MPVTSTESNLLFGLFALQNGLVDQVQLIAAFQAWTRDKSQELAEYLVARGDLGAEQRAAIVAIMELHLKKYGSVAESLAAVHVGRSTRESLARLGNSDLAATISQIGSVLTQEDDFDRTPSYAVGSVTSDGNRFRVLRPHARGGLGAVFVALDAELNREVALKQMLDRHADDDAARGRFLLEAEITGGLEHPGIVPVYGLGTYGDGRPYYAMRFIKGDNLKQAIERYHFGAAHEKDRGERSLELRKLLGRLIDVCNAIEYAHARGVLHRDIKPGNIIIGRHGEVLVVDWGLAKATGRADAGGSLQEKPLAPSSASGSAETLPGSAMGTPAYMSPEQATGDLESIGPQSDVYSLGATLYNLLTGRVAFDGSDVGQVLVAVQRGEFKPPRTTDRSIHPALEAICLRAMATQPGDRYSSPRALAEDIERWMADEPVTAYPESRSERMSRWVRRHREWTLAGVTALVLVTMISTLATLAINAARAAERSARNQVTKALAAETVALESRRSAKAEAESNFQTARQAVQDYLTTVSENVLLKQQDRVDLRALRKQLLDGALVYYQGFIARHGNDTRLLAALADAYSRVGSITSEIGSKEDALRSYEHAKDIRQKLAEASPATVKLQSDIAKDCIAIGVLDRETGRIDQAIQSLEHACAICQRLVDDHPAATDLQFDLAAGHRNLGAVLCQTGQLALGLKAFEQSVGLYRRLIDAEPGSTKFQKGLADSLQNLGLLYDQSGRPEEGLQSYEQSLRIRRKLVDTNPSVASYQNDLATIYHNIGMLQREAGNNDAALIAYEHALPILQKLADANPSVTEYQSDLARMHNSIGLLERATRHRDRALGAFERARQIQQKLVDANPSATELQSNLGATLGNIGLLHHDADNFAEALRAYEQAIAVQRKLADNQAPVIQFRTDLAWSLKNIGLVQRQAGHAANARRSLEQAVAIWEENQSPSGVVLYLKASALAQLSSLAGQGAAGTELGDRAMRALHQAVAAGYRDRFSFTGDISIDPLRSRADYRLLLLDLAMPANPFAETESKTRLNAP